MEISSFRDLNPKYLALRRTVRIPIHFHVIHDGEDGRVSKTQLHRQVEILNTAFDGTGFSFELDAADWTDHREWYPMAKASDQEEAARTLLQSDPELYLNLYMTRTLSDAGWSAYPSDLDSYPLWDGPVVGSQYLEGGLEPLDQGLTAVHEVGHWLGLHHTFEGFTEDTPQGGCRPEGDLVDDTPYEAYPYQGPGIGNACPTNGSRDSCPDQPGPDPIDNFMDYADDRCMTRFTDGQVDRMHLATARYRYELIRASFPELILHFQRPQEIEP